MHLISILYHSFLTPFLLAFQHLKNYKNYILCSSSQCPLNSSKINDGKDGFTTRQLFAAENTIQQLADNLRLSFHVSIAESKQNILLAQYQEQSNKILTDEQKSAVLHLLKPTAITCMVGRAGTGKSFCLDAAKSIWEAQGLRVHGIALSGIAADELSKDVGIPSTTIESFRYLVANQLLTLNPLDVVI